VRPSNSELRGLSLDDFDGDGQLEIIVTAAVGCKTNTWVYTCDGHPVTGWPQLVNAEGYAYGVFNDNVSTGDLDGDGELEIVVPSDVHYICAYHRDGTSASANPVYGGKNWGKVGVWESLDTELRGWGTCSGSDGRNERYRTNFAHGPSLIADVNGDCLPEVIAVGNVYDCAYGHPPGKYHGVYIFNGDRSRFNTGGFDWREAPVDTGAPLSENYNEIENCQPNPVAADIDGDGLKEILFSSYDGRVHCFWLDKTERHHWPFNVYQPVEGIYRFSSEPVVADLDNDGMAEILVATWVEKGSQLTGSLYMLDFRGNVIHEANLPDAFGSSDWNGGLAAPTLADIDGDSDLEIVLNTAHSGVVAYDLPGTSNARILWATGRGSFLRNGNTCLESSIPEADFTANVTAGQEPLTVRFSDLSRGCIASRSWNFGDGATSNDEAPVHTYLCENAPSCRYTVSLLVTNPFSHDTFSSEAYIAVTPCANDPVRVSGKGSNDYAKSIQTAYDNFADNGDTVSIQARRYIGKLILSKDIGVNLLGGLGCNYQKTDGFASIEDGIVITAGRITLEKIAIVPQL
jgi:hypothetical protein